MGSLGSMGRDFRGSAPKGVRCLPPSRTDPWSACSAEAGNLPPILRHVIIEKAFRGSTLKQRRCPSPSRKDRCLHVQRRSPEPFCRRIFVGALKQRLCPPSNQDSFHWQGVALQV